MVDIDYDALMQAARGSDDIFDTSTDVEFDRLDIGSVLEDESDIAYTTVQTIVSDDQYRVATHPCTLNEILRIPAGPGSGKTYAIAARIAYMLENGTKPLEILVLSMANRSVDALRNSLAGIIGPERAGEVDISTFHLFCGLILDQYSHMVETQRVRRRVFDKLGWQRLSRFFLGRTITLNGVSLGGTITAPQMDTLLANVTAGLSTVEREAKRHGINVEYLKTLVEYLNRHGVMRYSDLVTRSLDLMRITKERHLNEEKSRVDSDGLTECIFDTGSAFNAACDDAINSRNRNPEYIHTGIEIPINTRNGDRVITEGVLDANTTFNSDVIANTSSGINFAKSSNTETTTTERVNLDANPSDIPKTGSFSANCSNPLQYFKPGHHLIPRIAKYKAVFVDEFQDMYPLLTSVVQAVVTYPTYDMENTNKHLVVAGDPNQSIYNFLGASKQSMNKLSKIFPKMNVVDIPLSESFRCLQPILDAAVGVALDDNEKPKKPLVSNRETNLNVKPILVQLSSPESECNFIANEIVRLVCCLGGLICPKDIAVLTWTNAGAEKIQSILDDRFGLKSNKIALGNVWVNSPMHVYRDILSVIAGESDSSFSLLNMLPILDTSHGALTRASKVFSESTKNTDVNFMELFMFEDLASKAGTSLFLRNLYKSRPEVLAAIAEFLNQVQLEREILLNSHKKDPVSYGPIQLIESLARMAKIPSLHKHVFESSSDIPFSAYLESFNNSVHHSYDNYLLRVDPDTSFVDYFLQTYDSEVPVSNAELVLVSTIHAAKGMEFPIVFIAGMSQVLSIWDKYLAEPTAISPLLYVGLTRARDLVYLSTTLDDSHMSDSAQYFQRTLPAFGELDARTADNTNSFLTQQMPWSDNMISGLSQDLRRPVPLADKLARGGRLFRLLVKNLASHVIDYLKATSTGSFPSPLSRASFGTNMFIGTLRLSKAFVRRI